MAPSVARVTVGGVPAAELVVFAIEKSAPIPLFSVHENEGINLLHHRGAGAEGLRRASAKRQCGHKTTEVE